MLEQSINVQLDYQPHANATNDLTTADHHQSFEN